MLMGYGRMSTVDRNPAPQEDALRAAGCEKLFIEKVSNWWRRARSSSLNSSGSKAVR